MKNQNKQAFTLVELIVVITILAILGTIAFISLQGYSASARDSKRVSDIQNIKKSLELFTLNTSKYPVPDNGGEVFYSGALLWTQGIVGDNVTQNLSRNLNEKPTDPLTELEYTYSTINKRNKYELLSVYESGLIGYNNLSNQINAATNAYPKIDGNYNGIYVKAGDYYVMTPSLINSEIESTSLTLDYENIKSQIITGGDNYMSAGIMDESYTGGLSDFALSIYTGSLSSDSPDGKLDLVNIIITAYSGTLLSQEEIYQPFFELSTDEEKISMIDQVEYNKVVTYNLTETITLMDVADCETSGDIIYGTEDGQDTSLICDNDIIVCSGAGTGITIAACNAGATVLYTNQIFSSSTVSRNVSINSWAGGLYQWGNNADISLSSIDNILVSNSELTFNSTYSNNIFITVGLDPYLWTEEQQDNLWGDNGGIGTKLQRKGPCKTGYYIPKHSEWLDLISKGLWENDVSQLINDLKIPKAGMRYLTDGTYVVQDIRGSYWSSTPYTNSAFDLHLDSNINLSHADARANGKSIRCFKNK